MFRENQVCFSLKDILKEEQKLEGATAFSEAQMRKYLGDHVASFNRLAGTDDKDAKNQNQEKTFVRSLGRGGAGSVLE